MLNFRRDFAFNLFRDAIFGVFSLVAMTVSAYAQDDKTCPDHRPKYSLSADKPFIFSTACTQISDSQVEIENRVCPTTEKSIAFHWTRLNWVSGARGVVFGDCLVLRFPDVSAAVRIADSKISSNTTFSPTTEVFVPDLGEQGNNAYTETLEGNASVKEGGEREPFRLTVSYEANEQSAVSIKARISGREMSFIILLPPDVTDTEALNQFLVEQDLARISPMVEFEAGEEYLLSALDVDVSTEFIEASEIDTRAVIQIKPERAEAPFANFSFGVSGEYGGSVSDLIFCASSFGEVYGCF